VTFLSAGIAASVSMHVLSFLFLIIISGLFAVTSVSARTPSFRSTVTSSRSHTGLSVRACVYYLSVVRMPGTLHIIVIIIPSRTVFPLYRASRYH
jgi:hypothetical protein